MSIRTRWQTSTTGWRLGNGRVRVSNAWYRAAGRRISGGRQQYRNWLNHRAVLRGRSPLPERLTRPVRSSLPVYRNRINPATGRPRRDDRALGRISDASLARMAPVRRVDRARAAGPPREPGIYDLKDGHWVPARNVRPPDLSRALPRDAGRSR